MANGLIGAIQRNAIHVTRIFKAELRLFEKSSFIKYTDGENDQKIAKEESIKSVAERKCFESNNCVDFGALEIGGNAYKYFQTGGTLGNKRDNKN